MNRLGGQSIFKSGPMIIEWLKEKQSLLKESPWTHSYPHCWRHKTPLILRATRQWFIHFEKSGLRNKVLEAIQSTTWIPDWGHSRMVGMVAGRPDWCISRQRLWGTPLALWIHRDTQTPHPKTPELMRQVADRVSEEGIEVWEKLKLSDLIREEDDASYEKVMDTLDVWFDSGVTHACVLAKHPLLSTPADLYLEGSDQYRGWFQSSLITSVALNGKAPYKTVLSHGFIVDDKGHKMSKSLGNVIAPDKVINRLGADVLRLWIASTDYRSEMRVSDEILGRTSDTYRRIRNTARFLLSNLHDFDPNHHLVQTDYLLSLDRWVLGKAAEVQQTIQKQYEQYTFHPIVQEIQHFCSVVLGSFYLDIIKDRQYTAPVDSLARRSAQTALYHLLEALVCWLAPILSFTAEEIWQHMPPALSNTRPTSVFLSTWYDPEHRYLQPIVSTDAMNQAYWDRIMTVRDAVNKQLEVKRNEQVLGANLQAQVHLFCEASLADQLLKLGNELRFILITSSAVVRPYEERSPQAIDTEVEGLSVEIRASKHEKCARCWHYCADVGEQPQHPNLCRRCYVNVFEEGVVRRYA